MKLLVKLTSLLTGLVPTDQSTIIKPTRSVPVVINHIQVLQELKNKFAEKKSVVEQPQKKRAKQTQTQAFLSVYKKEVNHCWALSLEAHKYIIDSALQREQEFVDTHYVFYHAHVLEMIILHDFIKQIYSYINLALRKSDFNFLRFKGFQPQPLKTANRFLSRTWVYWDHFPNMACQMISVNLALFGNFNSWGESSFAYFLSNHSVHSDLLEKQLDMIFGHFKFKKRFIAELLELKDLLKSSTGNLMQIFIPKKSVDSLVYLSAPYGEPYSKPIVPACYSTLKNRHTKISPILEYYRQFPEKIPNLEALQARIMFGEPMFNPESGVKIFRYNTVSPEDMHKYEQKMQDIVARLMIAYSQKLPATRTEPFFKLNKYMHTQSL